MSVSFSVKVTSLFIRNDIFNSTVEPNKSPCSVALCSWGKVIVTFTASFPVGKLLETPPPLLEHRTLPKPAKDFVIVVFQEYAIGFLPKRGVKLTF